MSWITKLQLNQYRCYDSLHMESLESGLVILHGPNGAGKTNILEAISLLTPGRGLRKAKLLEMQRYETAGQSDKAWTISAIAESRYGTVRVGTGYDVQNEKRIVRINGETAKAQSALGEYLSCVWLTPQMDRLFIEGASGRRRFLDRLVFAFDPAHSGRVVRYEKALRQRSKLLQEENADPAWLEALESSMAETGVAIAAARLDLAEKLQQACDQVGAEESRLFPHLRLTVTGTVEELLGRVPAVEVEEMFKYQLVQTREQDSRTGRTATGPHRADMQVYYVAKGIAADQCSTGEQKALLIGLILAHSRLIAAEHGSPPILLLDEVAAHLDEKRRIALYDLLFDIGGQVWLTGTDSNLFEGIKGRARYYEIKDSIINSVCQDKAA